MTDRQHPDHDDAPAAARGRAPAGDLGEPVDVPEQDHDIAAVLRVTSFRRLWLALSGSSFGDWLGLLATTALAKQLGGDSYADANLAVAGVLILRLAPAVFLGPLAGALADRLDRKFVMVTGDVLRGLLFITIPLVGTLEWLFVATLLIECLALFWMPAKEATVPNLVPRNRLEAANQMSLVTTYGTAPVAALVFSGIALVNGILDNFLERLSTNPVDLALYVNAVTFIISGLVISRLPIPRQRIGDGAEQVSVLRSIGDGWRFIGTTPRVRGLVVGMLGAFAAAGFVIGLASTFVSDLGAGQPGYGVLFAAVFFGLAAGMWGGPRFFADFSRYRLFGLSLVAAGSFLAAIALIPNMVMAVLFTVGLGACGGIAWVTGYTLLGLVVEDAVRGRTFAFIASAARVVLITVLAAGPALAALIGRHTIQFTDTRALTYNGAAFVFLIGAVLAIGLGITAYRQMDDRPGVRLAHDLRQLWSARRDQPVQSARRSYPGVLIAFEGGDGTGKSTQAGLLADWLREEEGHEVVLTREPGGTPAGSRLRELLLNGSDRLDPRAEALLFAADRADHVGSLIRPALEAGRVVVTDRYVDSSVAYQGSGRELDGDDVARLSRWATDGLVPDLTVLLDVDPVISKARRARDAQRAGDDNLESQPDDFHGRVRSAFLEQARREPHRYLVIDAGLTVPEVQELVRARVRDVLPLSARRRAQLQERLDAEEEDRQRRAAAEAEVHRIDADLTTRRMAEAREREESRRRARAEAERQLQEEAARELREQQRARSRAAADRRAADAAAAATADAATERLPVIDPAAGADRAAPAMPAPPPAAGGGSWWTAPVDPAGTRGAAAPGGPGPGHQVGHADDHPVGYAPGYPDERTVVVPADADATVVDGQAPVAADRAAADPTVVDGPGPERERPVRRSRRPAGSGPAAQSQRRALVPGFPERVPVTPSPAAERAAAAALASSPVEPEPTDGGPPDDDDLPRRGGRHR